MKIETNNSAGLREVNVNLSSGLREVNVNLSSGLREVTVNLIFFLQHVQSPQGCGCQTIIGLPSCIMVSAA